MKTEWGDGKLPSILPMIFGTTKTAELLVLSVGRTLCPSRYLSTHLS